MLFYELIKEIPLYIDIHYHNWSFEDWMISYLSESSIKFSKLNLRTWTYIDIFNISIWFLEEPVINLDEALTYIDKLIKRINIILNEIKIDYSIGLQDDSDLIRKILNLFENWVDNSIDIKFNTYF